MDQTKTTVVKGDTHAQNGSWVCVKRHISATGNATARCMHTVTKNYLRETRRCLSLRVEKTRRTKPVAPK